MDERVDSTLRPHAARASLAARIAAPLAPLPPAARAPALAGPPSRTHLVLVPSYNPGRLAEATVLAARAHWNPVWVVVDGSTDGSAERLEQLAAADPGLTVLRLPRNRGKGAAILHGARCALEAGFTHALTMDSDGQHPTWRIGAFMAASLAQPQALILGEPRFDASAPRIRVHGRRLCNWWVNVETLWAGVRDSLCGFRVYPLEPLRQEMQRHPWMRRFDFDAESAVRLAWRGLPLVNLPAAVRYPTREEGGVSHFHYWRDNALLTWMHLRLVLGALWRWPGLVLRRRDRRL
jgi:glycosyltransferase involved in cell wall biosynthesis